MSLLAVILIVVVAGLILLFIGGFIVSSRHRRATEDEFRARVATADRDLAAAAAQDRGWDRPVLEAAVRAAWAERQGSAPIDAIALVSVRDLPGTEDDEATFQVTSGGTPFDLVLSRSGDAWS